MYDVTDELVVVFVQVETAVELTDSTDIDV